MEEKKNLTLDEMQKILYEKCGIEIDRAVGDDSPINTDDIIGYVPMEYPVEGDDCVFNLSMQVIDSEPLYVVSYERKQDGYVCQTFTGTTLFEAIFNTLLETSSLD